MLVRLATRGRANRESVSVSLLVEDVAAGAVSACEIAVLVGHRAERTLSMVAVDEPHWAHSRRDLGQRQPELQLADPVGAVLARILQRACELGEMGRLWGWVVVGGGGGGGGQAVAAARCR